MNKSNANSNLTIFCVIRWVNIKNDLLIVHPLLMVKLFNGIVSLNKNTFETEQLKKLYTGHCSLTVRRRR